MLELFVLIRRDPVADLRAFNERGAHVLVGTLGRLTDVFEKSDVLDTRRLEVPVHHHHLMLTCFSVCTPVLLSCPVLRRWQYCRAAVPL